MKNLKIGDIVLVEEPKMKRNKWALGRVTDVSRSRTDGLVRSVELQSRGKRLRRSVQNLYPLETEENDQTQDDQSNCGDKCFTPSGNGEK